MSMELHFCINIGGGVVRWWCHGKDPKAPSAVGGSCVINHKPHKLCTSNLHDCLMCMGFHFSCGFWVLDKEGGEEDG